MNEDRITELKSTLKAIKFGIDKGFISFEDVEDKLKEMIEELNTLDPKI